MRVHAHTHARGRNNMFHLFHLFQRYKDKITQ